MATTVVRIRLEQGFVESCFGSRRLTRRANQAEIEPSLYARECMGTRRFSDMGLLQTETRAWNGQTDRKRTRINWTFTRRKARKTFRYGRYRLWNQFSRSKN